MIQKQATSYNEAQLLENFVSRNLDFYMTEIERRTLWLAIARDKAMHGEIAKMHLLSMIENETDEVARRSEAGSQGIHRQIEERVLLEFEKGELRINRCPQCNRIVRTPLAQQCFWCGHDWHQVAGAN